MNDTKTDALEVFRFEHPDQWRCRGGWRESLILKDHELSHAVGVYDLPKELYQRCGLQTTAAPCGQTHGHGFVVATKSGLETHIGQDCGFKHAGLAFREIVANATRALEDQDRRRLVSDVVSQRESLLREAGEALRACEQASRTIANFNHRLAREDSIHSVFKKALASEGKVIIEIRVPDDEFERTKQRYRMTMLARIDGWEAVAMRSPRTLIQERVLPVVHALTEEGLGKLGGKALALKVKEAGEVRSTLIEASKYVALVDRFASKRNWVAFAKAFSADRFRTNDRGRRILDQLIAMQL